MTSRLRDRNMIYLGMFVWRKNAKSNDTTLYHCPQKLETKATSANSPSHIVSQKKYCSYKGYISNQSTVISQEYCGDGSCVFPRYFQLQAFGYRHST